MNELAPLYQAIRDLTPTKPGGFEGLVRDLFAEVTGQGYRLMKSGPQGGVDVLGDTSWTGLVIGMEGKHYAEETKLALDLLKSKVRDAVDQFPEMDLWVLAATRAVSQGDVKALEAVGAREGIDVLVLDWDSGAAEPPDLAILCAMAPNATMTRLGRCAVVDDAIQWLREHPAFTRVSQRLLERLKSPLVGYGAARAAMATWLRSRMKDLESALLAFDSDAILLESQAHRIARPGVSGLLTQWWSGRPTKVAVLLGEEGVGKTWAALGWWLQKSAEPDFPLTIVIPAKKISSADIDTVLATALFDCLKVRDLEFWKRRVQRWLSAESTSTIPALMVIIDGANQNWMFTEWSQLVLAGVGAERRGKVALLVTTRPDHFRRRLAGFQDLPDRPMEITLGPFDDAELDAVLATYSMTVECFDKKLLPLLRIPRPFHRAIRKRKELEVSGDITLERLVYEDWRGRQPAALRVLPDAGFREFVAGLARRFLVSQPGATISRKELLEELTLQSGDTATSYEGVLSEIIDGRWLVATDRSNQFTVQPTKLPFALGLALLEELSGVTSEEQARGILDTAFDVYRGTDIGVKILRCASTFAMMDHSVHKVVRKSVLSYWLEAQNFRSEDFEALWKCLGSSPETMLDIAQGVWFERTNGRIQDEVLVKAFGNAFKYQTVASACEARLTEWFEGYWLDPLVGEVIGRVDDDQGAQERKEATRGRASEWLAVSASQPFGLRIHEVDADGRAWGCYRAIELLSWLPRKPLLRPITAWAITRAVMGMCRQEDKFAWLLRWNADDHAEAEQALLDRASELASMGPVGSDAARVLLKALATRRSETALGVSPVPLLPMTHGSASADVQLADPVQQAPVEHVARLQVEADSITDAALRTRLLDRSSRDEDLRLGLSRWDPKSLVRLERRKVQLALGELSGEAGLEGKGQGVVSVLHDLVLLLEPQDLQRWKELAGRARQLGLPWNWDLQLGALLSEPAAEQLKLLELAPKEAFPDHVAASLAPLDAAAALALAKRFASAPPEKEAIFLLNYLNVTANVDIATSDVPLTDLFDHFSSGVREKALQVAINMDRTAFADALDASGWTWERAASKEEQALGSMLLAKSARAGDGGLVERVHPEVLGNLLETFPDQETYLSAFAEFVSSELTVLRTATSRSYPRAILIRHEGWSVLLEKRGEDLERWLQPFMNGENLRLFSGMGEQFPLIEAAKAVSARDPTLAASLMRTLLERDSESGVHMHDLRSAALRISSTEAQKVRQFVLDEANTDERLYEFAIGLATSGQQQRLFDQIEEDLASDMAGHVARALTLAGFVMPSEEADALWQRLSTRIPEGGWIATVADTALSRYTTGAACFHWFKLFLATASKEDALVHFALFQSTVDPRFFRSDAWKRERRASWPYAHRVHHELHVNAIKDRLKRLHDAWKREFLCTQPPLSNQFPARL